MEVVRATNKLVSFEYYQGNSAIPKKIEFPLYKCTEGECVWLLLYNDAQELDFNFFKYINYSLSRTAKKTRMNQARDIRLFLVFLQITGFRMDELSNDNIFDLIDFLGGNYKKLNIIVKNKAGEPISVSKNSRSTVINQLSSIRKYLNFLDIQSEALSQYNNEVIHNYINETLEGHIDHGKDISNYIDNDEYKALLDVILKANDESAYLKVNLIYKYLLQYYETNKLSIKNLCCENDVFYISVPRNRENKDFQIPEDFYNRLKSYLTENQSLYEKDFTKRLYEYYCKTSPKQSISGRKDLCSMLRKGCIYRIIFGYKGEIKPQELANILRVKNTSYLKYYIETANEVLNNGKESNSQN